VSSPLCDLVDAVAEKPGPLLETDLLAELLDELEDEKEDDPLDFPDEPEPLADPEPDPPLPEVTPDDGAGRSLWTQMPSASRVLVPGM